MTDINKQITLLYELALATNKHNHPEDTAKKFIKTILSRKGLQYGAIWIKVENHSDAVTFNRLYSTPKTTDQITITNKAIDSTFKDALFTTTRRSIIKGVRKPGHYAYFKLGEYGLLELYCSEGGEKLSIEAITPLQEVVNQLALSIDSGFSYQLLQAEIKQRKIAEQSVKNNEEKYRRIIDNVQLGLLEVDDHEVIKHANKPFCDILGYERQELIGKVASDLFFGNNDDEWKKKLVKENQKRRKGIANAYEARLRKKDGGFIWAVISGSPNYDHNGKVIGSIGIHLDITEQKKLASEIEFKESRLQHIYELSLDAMITINQRGEIIEWNPQAEKIFGFKKMEILNKKLSTTIIPPVHRKGHQNGMKHYLSTDEGPILNKRIEITAIRKSGEEFPIELTVFPIKYNNEHFFTAFLRDITKEKESKESMEKALERLKELNSLKSQFVAMTSHELRTPLTTIHTNLELLDYHLENSDKVIEDKLKKNVSRIEQSVERLNHLISNILLVGQMDTKKIPFNPESFDICKFTQGVILPSFENRNDGRRVTCKKLGKPYLLSLDKKLYRQIIENLLENAFKYSEGRKEPELQISFKAKEVTIKVKDHGIGIPPEDVNKLFDSFYRASNVGPIQGSGLGLAIVKEFVELNGGKIFVSSELNKGTEVKVVFAKN